MTNIVFLWYIFYTVFCLKTTNKGDAMRLQTSIRDSDYQKIVEIAKQNDDDINDLVRKALGVYGWVMRKTKEGYNIGAINKDGKVVVILEL